MPKDLWSRIKRAAGAGPDMRKPQYPGDCEPPAEGIAMARFIGYFEVGQHEFMREGALVYRERVRMLFELSGKRHPGRLVDGVITPYVISVETDLDLSPGSRFLNTFSRMNFENTATHMAELLGEAFVVSVGHRSLKSRPGVYATLDASEGYLIYPAKLRDEESGEVMHALVPPPTYRLGLFAWATADLEDWYELYIPGEWPLVLDEKSGEVLRQAKSKNVLQERIMSAKNWPEHPLAAVAMPGPDPQSLTPEALEEQRAVQLKEFQEENCRQLKAAIDKALAEFPNTRQKRRA